MMGSRKMVGWYWLQWVWILGFSVLCVWAFTLYFDLSYYRNRWMYEICMHSTYKYVYTVYSFWQRNSVLHAVIDHEQEKKITDILYVGKTGRGLRDSGKALCTLERANTASSIVHRKQREHFTQSFCGEGDKIWVSSTSWLTVKARRLQSFFLDN